MVGALKLTRQLVQKQHLIIIFEAAHLGPGQIQGMEKCCFHLEFRESLWLWDRLLVFAQGWLKCGQFNEVQIAKLC